MLEDVARPLSAQEDIRNVVGARCLPAAMRVNANAVGILVDNPLSVRRDAELPLVAVLVLEPLRLENCHLPNLGLHE